MGWHSWGSMKRLGTRNNAERRGQDAEDHRADTKTGTCRFLCLLHESASCPRISAILFFLLINSMLLSDWVELFEGKFLFRELLLVLSCVVGMTFSDTLFIAYRDEFN